MVRPKMKCPLPETWCSREYWAAAPWFTRAALMLLHALDEEQASSSLSPSSSSSSARSSSSSSPSPSSSAAAAYAAALPARGSFDTPAVGRWSDEELERLHYAPLAEDVRAQRRSWSEAFAAYRWACPRSPIADDEGSWDWALSCVRSRAFSGPYAGPPLKQRLGLAAALAAAGLGSVFALHAPPEQVLNGAIAAAVRRRRRRRRRRGIQLFPVAPPHISFQARSLEKEEGEKNSSPELSLSKKKKKKLFNLMYDALLSSKVKWHALCPLVDMANHSSRAASEMTYAYFGDALELSVGGLATTTEGEGGGEGGGSGDGHAAAAAAFEQGEQVFISYGPQTNDSLLQYYGFVEEANPNDVYRLVWEVDGGGGGQGGKKQKGSSPSRKKLTTLMSRSGPDEASVETVMEALGPATTRADALKAIHAAAAREAASWPTTAAEDAQAVKDRSGGGGGGDVSGGEDSSLLDDARFATALAFRLQKKRVLAAAAKSCLRQAGI